MDLIAPRPTVTRQSVARESVVTYEAQMPVLKRRKGHSTTDSFPRYSDTTPNISGIEVLTRRDAIQDGDSVGTSDAVQGSRWSSSRRRGRAVRRVVVDPHGNNER